MAALDGLNQTQAQNMSRKWYYEKYEIGGTEGPAAHQQVLS
jgi:hypothetical protein